MDTKTLSAEQVAQLRVPHSSSITVDGIDLWLAAIQPVRRTDLPGIVADGVSPYDRAHELVVLNATTSAQGSRLGTWGFVRAVGADPAPAKLERLLLRTTMEGERVVKVWMLERDW